MRPYQDRNGPGTRLEIINTLRHEPGFTKSQLCRFLGLSWGTISHHVRLLEGEGAIVGRALHGRRRLFVAHTRPDDMVNTQLARNPIVPRLLDLLDGTPGVGIQALAGELSVDRRIVRRNLDVLIDAGLVQQTRDYHPRFFVAERQRALSIIAEGTPTDANPALARHRPLPPRVGHPAEESLLGG